MLIAYLVLGGFVLVFFVLPLWLVRRGGRHVVGPIVDTVDYEQPYPGLGIFASREQMGLSSQNTCHNW